MVEVFRGIRRVLKSNGVVFLNLGDSYAGSGKAGSNHEYQKHHTQFGQVERKERLGKPQKAHEIGLKPKDLVGIPWRVAFALQQDGWWLRQDIIWQKKNPMPESVTDRCTKSHEYIFLLTKSAKYYYDADAIAEPITQSSIERLSQNIQDQKGSDRVPYKTNGPMKAVHKNLQEKGQPNHSFHESRANNDPDKQYPARNKRSVWTINTQPYKDAHFAVFPPKIPELCIKAGSKEGDTVLDPFFGSGTTGWVAQRLMRKWIGIELNEEYIKLANKRFEQKELFTP